jgi:hypothetical protein
MRKCNILIRDIDDNDPETLNYLTVMALNKYLISALQAQ